MKIVSSLCNFVLLHYSSILPESINQFNEFIESKFAKLAIFKIARISLKIKNHWSFFDTFNFRRNNYNGTSRKKEKIIMKRIP